MTAYLIARIHVTDMDQYQNYIKLTPAIVEQYGGKFIARGGDVITLEGENETRRVVLLEFPSVEQAQAFYNSDDYQHAITVRDGAATAQFIVINGVS
jgi:uncharacterized protein (DUF1330 family)